MNQNYFRYLLRHFIPRLLLFKRYRFQRSLPCISLILVFAFLLMVISGPKARVDNLDPPERNLELRKILRQNDDNDLSSISDRNLTIEDVYCGQACDIIGRHFRQSPGLEYPILHKDFDCPSIMQRLFLEKPAKEWPPPREPPKELRDEFTMHGKMPLVLRSQWYFASNYANTKKDNFFNESFIANLQKMANKGQNISVYGSDAMQVVQQAFDLYNEEIVGKHAFVVGTEYPWVEALLLNANVGHVTTMDYSDLISSHPRITAILPQKLAERYLRHPRPMFDFGVSYSSVEHSGLGRYGDALNPNGDLEAMAQAWCLVKPGGYFFLNVESDHGSSYLAWNAHRVYGTERLKHLTANWNVTTMLHHKGQIVRVMQKVE